MAEMPRRSAHTRRLVAFCIRCSAFRRKDWRACRKTDQTRILGEAFQALAALEAASRDGSSEPIRSVLANRT